MSSSLSSSGRRNSSIIRQFCKMGTNHKHDKKTAAVFPESEEQLAIERWSDESECMWLSSDSKSSSFSFDDDGSWDVFSIDSQDLFSITKNHELFLGKRISAFDGSSISPNEEASLVLDRTLKHELNEEYLLAWLLNFEESYSFDGFPNIWDQNKEFDVLQCDFQCSSFKTKRNISEADCSNPIVIHNSPTEDSPSSMSVSEVANLDEFDTNGPLFWPIEHKSNWGSSEISWDFFVMSPLKNGRKPVNVEGFFTPNKPIMLRLHESKKHGEKGLLCPRATTPTVLEWTTKDGKKNLRRINTMPSRLSKSNQHSSREKPTEFKDEFEEPKFVVDHSFDKFASECKEFVEEDFQISEEIPIETLVGLKEFDGHEGVDIDLIEDCFSLDELLSDNPSTLSR